MPPPCHLRSQRCCTICHSWVGYALCARGSELFKYFEVHANIKSMWRGNQRHSMDKSIGGGGDGKNRWGCSVCMVRTSMNKHEVAKVVVCCVPHVFGRYLVCITRLQPTRIHGEDLDKHRNIFEQECKYTVRPSCVASLILEKIHSKFVKSCVYSWNAAQLIPRCRRVLDKFDLLKFQNTL